MEFTKVNGKVFTEVNTDEALRFMDMQIGQVEAQLKTLKEDRDKLLNLK